MPTCCYYEQSDGHVFRVFSQGEMDCPPPPTGSGVKVLFARKVDDADGCYDCGEKLPVAYPLHKHHHYGHDPYHGHGYGPHYDHGYGPHHDHGYGPHHGYGHHRPDPWRCFDTLPSLWLSMWCRSCGW